MTLVALEHPLSHDHKRSDHARRATAGRRPTSGAQAGRAAPGGGARRAVPGGWLSGLRIRFNLLVSVVRPPGEDTDVLAFCRALGVPGLADVHVHFLPPRLLRRVWEYFDAAGPLVGTAWPIRYRWPDEQRVAHLRALGVLAYSALAYAHRPGMAADLNAWTLEFARVTPGCLPSATFY